MAYALGVIGGGNMGGAIVRGCVRSGVYPADAIIVADLDVQRLESLAAMGCTTTSRAEDAAAAETILIAVKPQTFPKLAGALSAVVGEKLVISIMAGLHSRSIRVGLGGGARVVRVMPNMPCQVGKGMSGIALGEGARDGDEAAAEAIFGAIGRTVIVNEALMHAVTAVSGSGPAYVFLLAEAMQQAASDLGLPEAAAKLMVRQTILGAATLLDDDAADAAELRRAVTSPGGTTAAALSVFERHNFVQVAVEALTAARDRGRELEG